jgi:hypothetical protein
VCVHGFGPTKAALLRLADQPREKVAAVGEDKVAGREIAGFLARAVPFDVRDFNTVRRCAVTTCA